MQGLLTKRFIHAYGPGERVVLRLRVCAAGYRVGLYQETRRVDVGEYRWK